MAFGKDRFSPTLQGPPARLTRSFRWWRALAGEAWGGFTITGGFAVNDLFFAGGFTVTDLEAVSR
jgi:hypothetical protein